MKKTYSDDLFLDIVSAEKETLESIARRHDASYEEVLSLWETMQKIRHVIHHTDGEEPRQRTLQKIRIVAKESLEARQSSWRGFWFWNRHFLQWGLAVAVLIVVGVIGNLRPQHVTTVAQNNDVLQNSQLTQQEKSPYFVSQYQRTLQALARVPVPTQDHSVHMNQAKKFPNVSPVGFDNPAMPTPSPSLSEQSYLSDLLANGLNSDELKNLYWRARKLSALGNYDLALKDYLVVAEHIDPRALGATLPLEMAECYNELNQKEAGVALLESFINSYGSSEMLVLKLDELKSQSF